MEQNQNLTAWEKMQLDIRFNLMVNSCVCVSFMFTMQRFDILL